MIINDLRGKAVVITGGTRGLGRAIGEAFGAEGAEVYLTHRWGSADEGELRRAFAALGAPEPVIVEADASNADEADRLIQLVGQRHDHVEVLVSNVSFAQVNREGIDGLKKRALFQSLEYSAWPLVSHVQLVKKRFGRYPRYTLGTSCDGPDTFYPGYDYVAVCKAVMETFCRYMAKHLFEEERANINIIRSRPVSTLALAETFGPDYEPFLRKWHGDDYFIEAEAVGQAALALCSGLMDAMTGQVILLDKAVAFQDNLMRLFAQREQYGLE
ncbi:MAG: SDR family oxidoreductase [Deltaproteobacteria bacterium]|nr:SDR family oxidoreductase [Deltaproteobacteria bacterium]